MNIDEFLSYCRSLDIKIWLDGARLRYSAPTERFLTTLRLLLGCLGGIFSAKMSAISLVKKKVILLVGDLENH
ncbi:hypothetical protein [Cyanosarcina burmensis]|jgi:hypothetical protein|uniref:TubC N-terminal docking domain-related protein n=1 Tax=Chroococcidiopsis sp. CCNUC1 TaxID=2653189 RepID=UPI0015E7AC9A